MSIQWVISLFRVACQYLCGGMDANVCVSSVWVLVSPTARPVVGQRVSDFIVHLRSYLHRVRGIHSSTLVAISVRNIYCYNNVLLVG